MRDPHVHVEKTPVPGFGNAAMRELILEATGLACDLPKTVGTGCGKRRPIAATSLVPEHVTCLACRDYARQQHLDQAETAESLLRYYGTEPELMARAGAKSGVTPDRLAATAREHRMTAARYASPATPPDGPAS
jgi:hypothetical protein